MIIELPHRQKGGKSEVKESKEPVAMGGEEFQPKSFSKVYTEFHIDKAKYESQKSVSYTHLTLPTTPYV